MNKEHPGTPVFFIRWNLIWCLSVFMLAGCAALPPAPPGTIEQEIIVKLKPGKMIEDLVTGFRPRLSYRDLAPAMRIWLVTHDSGKPVKVLKKIQSHSAVETAEFNKTIQLRREER